MEKIGGPSTYRCADCRSAIWNGRDFASPSTPPYPGPKPTTGYKHGPPPSDIVCHSRRRLVQRCLRLEFVGNVLWASHGRNGGYSAKCNSREPRLSRIDGEAWNQNWGSNTGVRHYRGCHQYGHVASPVPGKAVATIANNNGTEPDAEEHGSAGAGQR